MNYSRKLSALLVLGLGAVFGARLNAQNNYTPYTITTLAGNSSNSGNVNGQGTAALFSAPTAVAVDSSGNVYVADTYNAAIRKVTPSGAVSTFAGSTNGATGERDGTGTAALFGAPVALAIDSSGNLYVTDWLSAGGGAAAIRKITPAGVVSTIPSTGLNSPAGLAVDSSLNVYVADSANSVIRKITPGGTTTVFAGSLGNSGSRDGAPGTGQLGFPIGVAFDQSGNLYVTDPQFDDVRKVSSSGTLSTYAGTAGQPAEIDGAVGGAYFTHPAALASDASGNLYLVDNGTLVREITAGGTVSSLAGAYGSSGINDGTGINALFGAGQNLLSAGAGGIAASSSGNIYIADTVNNTIRAGVPFGNQPPVIQYQPSNYTMNIGAPTSFTVTVSGSNLTYQWYFNNAPISGATSATYTIGSTSAANAGKYYVIATNSFGSVKSNEVTLSVNGVQGTPVFSIQPSNVTVNNGASATFNAVASGGPTYQWFFNGSAISGATSSTYTIGSVSPANAGNYYVIATNSAASPPSSQSNTVSLAITGAPAISTQPASTQVNNGSAATLSVNAPGATSYQWYDNGVAIAGATGSTYSLGTSVGANQAGSYTVVAANSFGSTTSAAAVVTVKTLSQIVNLSTIDNVGSGASVLAAGFSVSGTASKNFLVRGVGPALSAFGLTNLLAAPQLTLYNSSSAAIASDTGWGSSSTLSQAFTNTGAFQLPLNSPDSALLSLLSPSTYTAQVTGVGGTTGTALIEIYDDSVSNTGAQLVNISSRANVTPTAPLTAGFVLQGSSSVTLVVRGDGPALAGFGLSGVLAQTTLTIFDASSHPLYTNTGWSGTAALSTAFSAVGAFPLTPGSGDSTLLVTLAPGNYSAQVSSPAGSGLSGLALVEVYELQ